MDVAMGVWFWQRRVRQARCTVGVSGGHLGCQLPPVQSWIRASPIKAKCQLTRLQLSWQKQTCGFKADDCKWATNDVRAESLLLWSWLRGVWNRIVEWKCWRIQAADWRVVARNIACHKSTDEKLLFLYYFRHHTNKSSFFWCIRSLTWVLCAYLVYSD